MLELGRWSKRRIRIVSFTCFRDAVPLQLLCSPTKTVTTDGGLTDLLDIGNSPYGDAGGGLGSEDAPPLGAFSRLLRLFSGQARLCLSGFIEGGSGSSRDSGEAGSFRACEMLEPGPRREVHL
jgi:hypothetical protein